MEQLFKSATDALYQAIENNDIETVIVALGWHAEIENGIALNKALEHGHQEIANLIHRKLSLS
jgi:hypothetical protein